MLPREEFKTATDRMQEKHNAGGNRQLEAAMQRGRVLFNRIGFGGEESSVIKASQLPIVNDMLRRLREKYHDTLQRHSTDAILIQLENYIRFEIEKAKAAKDEQREFDFTKALNVLIAADSHLRKHENPNQSGIVHNTALREVLALMWLAASDMNMILLPTREREILQLSESERSDARQKIIKEESVDNVFILTLKEIRRAHNADTPERSLDKVNDFQSCAIGTFGRLILNSAPLNCVAALTVEMNLHPADLERSSVELANIQVPNIDFSRIPRLCEEFICEQLQERSADVKEAIYRSMNEFINNDVEYQDVTGSNIQMNIARLAEYKRIHRLFSDSLKPTISYEEFMTFMDIHAPGYVSALMQIDEVPSLLRIYDEYVQAITPESLFSKNFYRVYINQDQRFIDAMRKIGRDIVKASEVGNLVFQDEGIIECRIRIHKIHDRMNIIHQLILNETKFAILAYLSLEETLSSTNKQEWLEISKEIQSNIRNYHEEISLSLQPELKAEIELLDNLLEVKLPAAVKSANLAVYEEESVISEDKFSPVKKRIKETSMKCVDMVNDIEKVSSTFDNIVKVNTNAQMKTSEVYTLLRPLFQMGDNRSLMIGPVSWTSTLIALAQARLDPQDRDEELEHLNRCINLCSRVQVQLRAHIADIIPATFNSMRVHGDQEQSWQSRFESVRLLDAMFPGNNIRARCLETFKSISWTTEIVKIIQSDRPLADKKAELEFINQMLKLSYEPARYKAALQVIGSKFVSAGSDENSGLTWRKRRESIALLTDVFKSEDPQAIRGENIDLRYQAFRSLKEIEESGRRLFTQSEQAKMVFDCADIPLILAKFDYENRKSELVTPELFQKNFEAWVAAARQLLPELADKTPRAPDASIDTSKVEQFLILTICRNLGLTDMRCEDMAVLRKICRTYLQNSQEIAKVQFPLQVVDTLEKRLNYLAIHLSCLITTLTPLATLYNTGHVRNMDLDTSNALLEGLKKKGNYIIVRTSSGNPATITCSSLLNEQIKQIRKEGGHIKKDESFPVNNVAIITSEGERIEFEVFHLFNYRAQKDMYQCSVPALVLLPYAQLMRAEAEIQAEFRQAEGVIQDQYRFAHADVRPSSHSAQQTVSTSLAGVFDFRDQGERSVVNDNNTPQSVAPRNNGPAPK